MRCISALCSLVNLYKVPATVKQGLGMFPGLHSFLESHPLTVTADVSNATVGINAELLAGLNSAEIAARLGTGSPTTPIQFIVVFDGPGRETPSRLDDGLQRRRTLRAVLDAKVPVIVAPALAAAQLAQLYNLSYITHIAGAEEAVLWSDAPLLLNLFAAVLKPETAVVLRRRALLNALRVAQPALLEAVLGAGHNAIITPPLPLCTSDEPSLDEVCRTAFQFGGLPPPPPPPPPPPVSMPVQTPTGPQTSRPGSERTSPSPATSGPVASVSALRAAMLAPCAPEYVSQLQRAIVFAQRQPVLNAEGLVELLNLAQLPVPQDLTEILGRQLAPEMYWFLSKGLLGVELLHAMAFGVLKDAPADLSGASATVLSNYAQLQRVLQPLRQQSYSLLASTSHRYFQVKSVDYEFGELKRTEPLKPSDPEGEDAAAIVASAVAHAREVAVKYAKPAFKDVKNEKQVSVSALPELLAKSVGGANSTPSPLLINTATLALRELVETAICWYMATGKAERENTKAIVQAMPWA